ncbi:MAG: DUF5107 domain-containing protein [Lachnospiraceae bacterium]|nr:DUF5107 domain-containing protein [Lachnospiraceae bacterium]
MSKATVRREKVQIPTYRIAEPEKSPVFLEKRAYQGSTGRVYPLPVTEKIYDEKEMKEYNAIILENDYLYVMVLPELGGRIQRALDKTNGYDFVYYNHVIKPALVGLAGPWISGGIEFNWPQHHRPSTFSPVDSDISENSDGSVTAYVGETDIMYGTKCNLAITLYPDKAYIELKGQLYNPTDLPQTFLWWANPAVPVNDYTYSVFPPDVNAVMDHGKRAVSTFPIATGEYYKVDYSAGVDISRYKNIKVPTSYMAAHSDFDFIGNYDESREAGLLHVADHHVSPGKKQWTWGNGDFGKMWDKNLTDEDGPYIELMTGVYTDNQPDFTWLKPNEEKTFTQYFMPYKKVGRVSNATKDITIGVSDGELRVYSAGEFEKANVSVKCGESTILSKNYDLKPGDCIIEPVGDIHDYIITVSAGDKVLCSYKEFIPADVPVPSPMDPLKDPKEIESLEELYLAGQHLEQYRHATRNPEAYYLEGLKRDKTDIRLNNAYGLLLLRRGQAKEAEGYFRTAIKKQTWRNPNPYSGECYFNLGLALRDQGCFNEAFDALYKATWSAETAGNAFYEMAAISSIMGRPEEALEFVDKALIRNWHNMNARVLKLELMRAMGKDTTAFLEESYAIDRLSFGILYRKLGKDEFISAMGNRADNWLNLVRLYMRNGLFRVAYELLSVCPLKNPMIEYWRGHVLMVAGDMQGAVEVWSEAEKLPSDFCFPNNAFDIGVLKEVQIAGEYMKVSMPMAAYYLGNILYDKKRYAEAEREWEKAAALKTDFAMVYRNLSIVYYNKNHNSAKALDAIGRACALEPDNSRFILEQDQLLARVGADPLVRLSLMEGDEKLVEERDALCLRYVRLLNMNGKHEEAYEMLKKHVFHVWEGGEGKIADEYKNALFALSSKALANGEYDKALELCEKTFTYPDNLGEGKLFNVPDNKAWFMIGEIKTAKGDKAGAMEAYKKAAEGEVRPELVRYYNDIPSDYIFWLGLAKARLGLKEEALAAMRSLIDFGNEHLNDKVEYDFFAVSMPELEVYEEDIKKNNDDYCKHLVDLGVKGLSEIEK